MCWSFIVKNFKRHLVWEVKLLFSSSGTFSLWRHIGASTRPSSLSQPGAYSTHNAPRPQTASKQCKCFWLQFNPDLFCSRCYRPRILWVFCFIDNKSLMKLDVCSVPHVRCWGMFPAALYCSQRTATGERHLVTQTHTWAVIIFRCVTDSSLPRRRHALVSILSSGALIRNRRRLQRDDNAERQHSTPLVTMETEATKGRRCRLRGNDSDIWDWRGVRNKPKSFTLFVITAGWTK